MTHREQDILHAIVECYIQHRRACSLAYYRAPQPVTNSAPPPSGMSWPILCDAGYLSQPHTSAGRVPTEKAFRSYVQSLARGRLLMTELRRVRGELSQMSTMEARVERSSRMLTEMTHSIGITAAIPTSSQTLDQIELIGSPIAAC